jgi:HEAT repeat protein
MRMNYGGRLTSDCSDRIHGNSFVGSTDAMSIRDRFSALFGRSRKPIAMRVAVALSLVAIVSILIRARTHRNEPTFHGKTVSYWSNAIIQNDEIDPNHHPLTLVLRARYHLGIYPETVMTNELTDSDDPAAVSVMIELLKDPDWRVRKQIALWVGWMKSAPKALAPALIVAVRDENVEVRRYAANSLGSIGPDAEAAIPVLMGALHDGDKELRRYAIWALGKIGPAARAAVPDLIEILKHDDRSLWQWAAYAVGEIGGPEARGAVPLLVKVLKECLAHGYDPVCDFDAAFNTLTTLDPSARDEVMGQK